MEGRDTSVRLEYNTEREKLGMPEYGRNVLTMIEMMKEIPDREKRSQQARAIVKTMELLNPQVHSQEDYEHKLWDHLYVIAGFDLDIDSPYPAPKAESFITRPVPLPMKGTKIRATHYGRNIERIIDLICTEPDGDDKNAMIRSLALYMRQQYLIWNKDSVADSTIFADIEKLSGYKIKVPEGIELGRVSETANFSRPSIGIPSAGGLGRNNWKKNKKNFKKNNSR